MGEYDYGQVSRTDTESGRPAQRGGVSLFMLLVGLGALVISGNALSGGAVLNVLDARWLVVGATVLIGLVLLGNSLRPRRGR